MTPSALHTFRNSLTDCDVAAYVDLGSRTVLSSDGALNYAQEYLDALCASAADLFATAPSDESGLVENVLFFSPTGSRFFVRNPAEPNEALCCICAPDADVDQLIEAARTALAPGAQA